jgi:ferredoxin
MSTQLVQPEFRVRIDSEACHKCGRCVQQCGWGVYTFTERPIPDTPPAAPVTAA